MTTMSWVGQKFLLFPLSERNGTSLDWGVASLLCQPAGAGGGSTHLQMNTHSICKKSPSSEDGPGDGIDDDNEESPGLGLPSSSLTLDSSVPMAHKDMALHTKSRTNHVQT